MRGALAWTGRALAGLWREALRAAPLTTWAVLAGAPIVCAGLWWLLRAVLTGQADGEGLAVVARAVDWLFALLALIFCALLAMAVRVKSPGGFELSIGRAPMEPPPAAERADPPQEEGPKP